MIGLGHGESQIGGAVFAGVLNYHVDDDVRRRDGAEYLRRQARPIRHPDQGNLGFVLVAGHAGDQYIAHAVILLDQPGAFDFGKTSNGHAPARENFLANSTERISKTFAPVLASSIISS